MARNLIKKPIYPQSYSKIVKIWVLMGNSYSPGLTDLVGPVCHILACILSHCVIFKFIIFAGTQLWILCLKCFHRLLILPQNFVDKFIHFLGVGLLINSPVTRYKNGKLLNVHSSLKSNFSLSTKLSKDCLKISNCFC